VEHYYSYWQVHQLHYLQHFPDLYKNLSLLNHLTDEVKQHIHRPWSPDAQALRDFEGQAQLFNALSFWITVYDRELERTFALVPEKHNMKRLSEIEHVAYKSRIAQDAKMVANRFGVTEVQLFSFLSELIDRDRQYRSNEHYKLSEEIRDDIASVAHLVGALTGYDWDQIAQELGRKSSYWNERDFRHIDPVAQERDEAYDLLKYFAKGYATTLSELHVPNPKRFFLESDLNEMLDYCDRQGLSVLMTSLSGMSSTEEEMEVKFRHVTVHTNIKNTLTALECLLRGFPIQVSGPSLATAINAVMTSESWWGAFAQRQSKGLTRAETSNEFFRNLSTILNDQTLLLSEDTYWARTFLVTVLSRNFSIHNFPDEDQYYGESIDEMLRATVYAILYSWQLGRNTGWV
jgi:hypothetical protein